MTEPSPVERLYAVLAAAGITLTAAELAEVLWLAARVAPAAVAPGPAAAAPPARPGPPAPPGPDGAVHGDILPPPPGADVYAAAGPAVDGAAALPVLLRADRALPAQRRLTRALRPLRRPVPSSRERELDENATADLVADTGVLDLALRPRRERWLDVALVVDDGLSMQVWRELSRELGALLQSAGIFRRVRSYGLDTRHPDGPYLSHRPFAAPGTPLPPRAVCPADGRGVVLVLSDAVGAGWREGRIEPLLAAWARTCPTAVLQPLPPRLWPGTGLRTETKLLTGARAGCPNTGWRVADPVLPPDLAPFGGLPVPVLEFGPAAVASWAALVAGTGAITVQVAEVDGAGRPAADVPRPAPGAEQAPDMRSRLALFHAAASPEAFRLAGHLAAVRPLTLPVMRLVQRAVLGGRSSPAHLAEVLLGGLLRRTPADGAPADATFTGGAPADRPAGDAAGRPVRYDFRPGLRELLLESLPSREVLGTAALVTDLLRRGTAGGRYLPALQAGTGGSAALPPGARAFAGTDTALLGHFAPGRAATDGGPVTDVPFGALAERDGALAALVREQRWPEAVELGEQVLERVLAESGPDHPAVLGGRFDLAEWIGAAGAPQTALRLCRDLLADLLARLGPDHGRVDALRARIGHWSGWSGDWAAAVAAYRDLLPEQERRLGTDHPDALFSRHQTAFWTAFGGDTAAALPLYRDLLPRQIRVLGPEDRETLRTRANIASMTGLSGRSAEALDLWRALLPDLRRTLGPGDQLTLVAEAEIGHWTGVNGDPAAALRMITPLLPRLAEALGPHHPTPYGFRRRAAQWTGETGDAAGAAALLRDLLADAGRWLTPEHPEILVGRAAHAYWTACAGGAAEGLRRLRDLLPELDGILGPDHPDTRWAREAVSRLAQEEHERAGGAHASPNE
ncbi:SAV_2336 family protein [Kitasatospora sp. NBC_00374]|uniref:SAV_2336 N-terminal domain-related protein n=1 Tax=Kitasatospora sp. NBC_00374 TaxID=2975964 RepID=UPI0030E5910C